MPGLDDSARSDTDVLLEISDWLQTAYQERISISGIVYLHRISDARIGISGTKNLRMLQKLCGNSMLDRVVFATTFWDKILMEHGAEREKELASREDFLHPMIRRGTTLTRHIGGRESAYRIVELLTNTNTRCTLDIQIDMVERGLLLNQTALGKEMQMEILALPTMQQLAQLAEKMDQEHRDQDEQLGIQKAQTQLRNLLKRY